MKHVHADLMLQYAQDTQETHVPWVWWAFSIDDGKSWYTPSEDFQWRASWMFRRKPDMVRV